MIRILIGAALVAVVLAIYSFIDCLMTDPRRIRGVPKWAWAIIVVVLPVIGPVLWFLVGKGKATPASTGPRTVAPDDDPEFLSTLADDADLRERLEKLEGEFADRDDDDKPAS